MLQPIKRARQNQNHARQVDKAKPSGIASTEVRGRVE
jgi:DNA-directed RNA polymerase subunit K/omega